MFMQIVKAVRGGIDTVPEERGGIGAEGGPSLQKPLPGETGDGNRGVQAKRPR